MQITIATRGRKIIKWSAKTLSYFQVVIDGGKLGGHCFKGQLMIQSFVQYLASPLQW